MEEYAGKPCRICEIPVIHGEFYTIFSADKAEVVECSFCNTQKHINKYKQDKELSNTLIRLSSVDMYYLMPGAPKRKTRPSLPEHITREIMTSMDNIRKTALVFTEIVWRPWLCKMAKDAPQNLKGRCEKISINIGSLIGRTQIELREDVTNDEVCLLGEEGRTDLALHPNVVLCTEVKAIAMINDVRKYLHALTGQSVR